MKTITAAYQRINRIYTGIFSDIEKGEIKFKGVGSFGIVFSLKIGNNKYYSIKIVYPHNEKIYEEE